MKKILLLTVCAFGLLDLVPTADCYAAASEPQTLSNSQKKRQRQQAAAVRKAEAVSGLGAAAEETAPVALSTPSRDLKPSEDAQSETELSSAGKIESFLTEEQARRNIIAAYGRVKQDNRSTDDTLRRLVAKYLLIDSFSASFKKELGSIQAANQEQLTQLVTRLEQDSGVSKAWGKNVASAKEMLGTLRGAIDQLKIGAEAYYQKENPEPKDQNAIAQAITSILKSIESIEGSIDRLTANEDIQKYLTAFVKDLTAKTKDAFLDVSKRGKANQIAPKKVTVTTAELRSIKEKLKDLSEFLLKYRTFWGTLKGWNGKGTLVVKAAVKAQTEVFKDGKTITKAVPAKNAVSMSLPDFYASVFSAKTDPKAKAEDAFTPTVDSAMFEGKKDKDIPGMLKAYQEEVQELIKQLQEFLTTESAKAKDQENAKNAKAKDQENAKNAKGLVYKAKKDTSVTKAMALKVDDRGYKMASASQQKAIIEEVKASIIVIETYRQELEHMLDVIKKSQEKSAGSQKAKEEYELILGFHDTLDKVLGAMVSKVGDPQSLKPIYKEFLPSKEQLINELKNMTPAEKEKKLEEMRRELETLKKVDVESV